jgi:N-acetylneuraminic acid mutarotase
MHRLYRPALASALFLTLSGLAGVAAPARAHFIWIVPDAADAAKAKVVFSENLEPDDGVPVENIAATKLFARTAGQPAPLDWAKGEHAYLARLPGDGAVVGGVCRYGVLRRGEGKPFLLAYYPKLIRGAVRAAEPWGELPLEIVPREAGRFRVVFAGRPVAGAEVVVVGPTGDAADPIKAGADGEFQVRTTAPGLYGVRTKHFEAKAGEHAGKAYEEVRHYATLVFRAAGGPARGAAAPARGGAAWPPLPRAVSSFGAAVTDGWLYVYGGHCARTHQYSTDAVVGTLHRLNLSAPAGWEELPPGPALQGLAAAAHGGKVYRVGGMQPRNRPGEKADNHSLATCAVFDPAAGAWEPLPDLPAGRSSHDAVVGGDRLVVVGGWKLNGAGKPTDWHDTALVMDLNQRPLRWREVKQPFRRRALTAAVHGDKVYVIGGMTDDSVTERTVNVYDPAADAWTTGPDLPGPARNGFAPAAVAAGGRLYASPADGKLYRLTERGDAWEACGGLQQPRIVHRLVAARDDLLVAVGGAAKGDNVALTEAVEQSRKNVEHGD